MSRPPSSTPHSDIAGVHRDEARSTDVAAALGESAGDLEKAEEQTIARPDRSSDKSRDDRSAG